ncbi:FKBP-type peptidyl-prolyl cis-trans isomerase [Porphyrobacter sp. AAP82]|uniref:FKBP-type peptidyl-prolyl cis-trans isomerase n=1 Tax=Porphyrobacter sp. AAP82 TaxID=1248917 RepID=UPI0002D7113B|nr:FKBP-type peptidyl-prolyl cis-trans isomerase [Porphyrobacter sp. AAP82]
MTAAALLAAAAPAAAQDRPAGPDAQNPAWHAQQQLYLLALKAEDGWYAAEDGLRWRWVKYLAAEARPKVSDVVSVHYEGKLIDGTVFDSSYARGAPATFPLARLVPGWQIAIPNMGVGEIIEIAIPADLAYGPIGRGPIPGNATLLFKVELVRIGG